MSEATDAARESMIRAEAYADGLLFGLIVAEGDGVSQNQRGALLRALERAGNARTTYEIAIEKEMETL